MDQMKRSGNQPTSKNVTKQRAPTMDYYHNLLYGTNLSIPYHLDQRLFKTQKPAAHSSLAHNFPILSGSTGNLQQFDSSLLNAPFFKPQDLPSDTSLATNFIPETAITDVGASKSNDSEFITPISKSLVTAVLPSHVPNYADYQKTLSLSQAAVSFGASHKLLSLNRSDLPQPINSVNQQFPQLPQDTLQPHQQQPLQPNLLFNMSNKEQQSQFAIQQKITYQNSLIDQYVGKITKLQAELKFQKEDAIKKEEKYYQEKKKLKEDTEQKLSDHLGQAKKQWELQAKHTFTFAISKAKDANQLQRNKVFLEKCLKFQKRKTHRVFLDGQRNLSNALDVWKIEEEEMKHEHQNRIQYQLKNHGIVKKAWAEERTQLISKHRKELDAQERAQQEQLARYDQLQTLFEAERMKTKDFEELENAHQNLLSSNEQKCRELQSTQLKLTDCNTKLQNQNEEFQELKLKHQELLTKSDNQEHLSNRMKQNIFTFVETGKEIKNFANNILKSIEYCEEIRNRDGSTEAASSPVNITEPLKERE